MAAGHSADVFHHVRDSHAFEIPQFLGGEIPLPLGLTKFMLLQVVALVAALLIFRGLAQRVQSGQPVQGRWWNFWEALAMFIRDEVVRPTIGTGHHDDDHGHSHGDDSSGHEHAATGAHPADRYLPFVWSVFFYVLFCNLLGAIPWLGAATGEINVTAVLAVVTFGAVVMYGSQELGAGKFWLSLAPSMELPGGMKYILLPMIWLIELLGLFIKHGVLAVRLFANMMAGHTVIAVILGFIAMVADSGLFYVVLPASIFGQVFISALELFVAFLQAYIFAFLATLFIGMAVHPH